MKTNEIIVLVIVLSVIAAMFLAYFKKEVKTNKPNNDQEIDEEEIEKGREAPIPLEDTGEEPPVKEFPNPPSRNEPLK
jgi:hypothetical protein